MRESRLFSNAILRVIARCCRCDIVAFSARGKARDKPIIQRKLLRDIREGISVPQEPREVLSVNFSAKLGVIHTHTHTHTYIYTQYFVPAPNIFTVTK